jgi:hypothetical protein
VGRSRTCLCSAGDRLGCRPSWHSTGCVRQVGPNGPGLPGGTGHGDANLACLRASYPGDSPRMRRRSCEPATRGADCDYREWPAPRPRRHLRRERLPHPHRPRIMASPPNLAIAVQRRAGYNRTRGGCGVSDSPTADCPCPGPDDHSMSPGDDGSHSAGLPHLCPAVLTALGGMLAAGVPLCRVISDAGARRVWTVKVTGPPRGSVQRGIAIMRAPG